MSLDRHPLWRKPQHHLDVTESSQHVHWIELFYDLAHVVAIFMLGNFLSHHLTVSGFLIFVALFVVIWFAWFDLSLFNSLYVSTDMQHRYIMTSQIITIMVMSASIPHITDTSWPYFAIGYGINRAFIAFLYWRVRQVGDSDGELPRKLSRNFFGSAFLFLLSAFLPHPYSYLVFGLGLLILALLYALPRVGALECHRFVPRFGHMSERFALLLLIVAGEGFFKLVVTLSIKGIDNVVGDVLFNYVIGGAAIFVLCWMYFDFAGNGKPRNTDKKDISAVGIGAPYVDVIRSNDRGRLVGRSEGLLYGAIPFQICGNRVPRVSALPIQSASDPERHRAQNRASICYS
ncbi:hypothetical protein JCM19236_922 [Vibrio sp. JCM 19236]|nr:hypothetical protein JCM19236_922 [Vibrio sp. JCM 19236]